MGPASHTGWAVPKYELAVFDFDGTLADTFPWFAGVLDQVAERFGFRRIGADEVETLRGADTQEILRRLAIPLWKMPMIAAHMRTLAAQQIDQVQLFADTRRFLHDLHGAGVRIGVVSSNTAETIRFVLGPETASLVWTFACGASLFGKPAKLAKVLRRSGTAPARAIYVGDEIRDVVAARATGMASGAVSWGYNRVEALAARSPDHVFDSFDDMLRKVAG